MHKHNLFLRVLVSFLLCSSFAFADPSTAGRDQRATIVALVDNKVITQRDLEQRVRLALLMHQMPLTQENKDRARPEIRQTMIHEAMKLSLADKFDLLPDKHEVRAIINDIGASNPQIKGGIYKLMQENHIPAEVFEKHIRAEVAWRNYLQGRFQQQIQVGSGEVNEIIKGLQDGKNYPGISDRIADETFSFSQIVFPFKPFMTDTEKHDVIQQASSLRNSAPSAPRFLTLAKQNNARIASKDNISGSNLPGEVKNILKRLSKGGVSQALEAEFGAVIFTLKDYIPRPKQFSEKHIRMVLTDKKMGQIDMREMQNLVRNAHVEMKN
ncbi:SurA N-terminal domain-containing protein [Alphaproteobacteria bacterium]|nr:SurA N-terminal domain-containing protein [Alphaproteobacteria bacterium]